MVFSHCSSPDFTVLVDNFQRRKKLTDRAHTAFRLWEPGLVTEGKPTSSWPSFSGCSAQCRGKAATTGGTEGSSAGLDQPREVRDVCTGAHGEALKAYNETPHPAQSLVVSLVTPLLDQTAITGSVFKGMLPSSILPARIPEGESRLSLKMISFKGESNSDLFLLAFVWLKSVRFYKVKSIRNTYVTFKFASNSVLKVKLPPHQGLSICLLLTLAFAGLPCLHNR